jgi:alkylation response protein AidB-like acyl-CoA dehydrogenase
VDGGWAPARTVLTNESAMIGDGHAASTFARLLTLAQQSGATDDPLVRQRLADVYTRERLLDTMGARITDAIRRRQRPPMDPSLLKLFVAESKVRTGNLAMQLGGAASQAGDEATSTWAQWELMFRFMVSIGGGTNEVQRNNLAERALGLPKEPGFDRATPWRDIPRN